MNLGLALSLFLVVLAFLFRDCFFPGYTLFSNDGPLGALMADSRRLPASFKGGWNDLNSLGFRDGGASPSITYALLWVLGPIGFSKFYAALTLLFLGSAAWCLFRSLGLANVACVLGGFAAALNSNFFSAACWGVAAHPLTIGLNYLALAALAARSPRLRWAKLILAGLAVGMGVVEGADIGMIFSLYVTAFAIYQSWTLCDFKSKGLVFGIGKVAVISCVAVFIAAKALFVLVGTQIQGVAEKETKEQRWDFATQWSLPKREALGFLVPGIFGYRMDTPDGGVYWGAVGRDPNWDRYFANGKQGPPPQGFMRFSGGGIYAGVLVVLVAVWTAFQGLRKTDSVFSLHTRRWIWFWIGVFVVSLLLAFGRFAPFYQLFFALPKLSTIRNPAKFTYPCSWALLVLFGYGINGLWRTYLEPRTGKPKGGEGLLGWWQRVRGFDRQWTIGCGIALAVAALGWFIFSSSGEAFEHYLQDVQFDAGMAHAIAGFSLLQAGLFLLFLFGAILLLTLVISGAFRGDTVKWAAVLLGLFLVVDLGRANQPWVITWNWVQKYASNPIIDFLKKDAYEHRVAGLPRWLLQVFQVPPQLAEAEQNLRLLYGIEWTQHHFLFHNIQSLDVIQMPRMPEDLQSYEVNFIPRSSNDLPLVARHWQLTNTRYLLGAAPFLDVLNRQFDPAQHRFRIAQRFNIVPKPEAAHPPKLEELTATIDTNGPFALFEFTGALPRAALYSSWETTTNVQVVLGELAKPDFDVERRVIVADNLVDAPQQVTTNAPTGKVSFTSYSPTRIVLDAQALSPSILLLNDHFDPHWHVLVDGHAARLLRCNYIMRGVQLPTGSHTVEFRFSQPMTTFYITLSGVVLGIGLLLLLLVSYLLRPSPSA